MYFLHDCGFQVLLVNPGKARKYAESLNQIHKTDKLDAVTLAWYGHAQQHKLTLWQPEAPEIRELKVMIRRLDALEKDLQREQNRQEAAQVSLSSDRVAQSLKDMIETLKAEIERLQQDIDNHIDRFPELKRNRQLLQSIKGIGTVMSRELVYLFASKRFNSAKQAAAYIGLIPILLGIGYLLSKKRKTFVFLLITFLFTLFYSINYDIHDISRVAKTYALGGYFMVTPLLSQQELCRRIIRHWVEGFGSRSKQV